jgi:hypothetical protein
MASAARSSGALDWGENGRSLTDGPSGAGMGFTYLVGSGSQVWPVKE